jgi:hypothetical protein
MLTQARIGRTNLVSIRRSTLVLLAIVLTAGTLSARAQVAPSATARTWSLSAGAEGSVFQPDYAGGVDSTGKAIAQTSPNRLYGIGAYADMKFSRWLQIEGEARFLRFNQYYFGVPPIGNGENTYQIGPRIPIGTFKRFTPYGKLLVGLGNGSFVTNSFMLSYGGGADYRLNRKFTIRAFDFEYQRWSVTPTLYPYGGSVGLSYRIF